jgi:predicted transcriptional regulator
MAEKREFGSVDLETGEILPHVLVAMQQKIPNGFAEGWVAMAQGPMVELAVNIKSVDDWRVLSVLLGYLDFENHIRIEQTAVAEKLGMHRQNVNKAIKRLLALGVVIEGPKVGRSRTYRLNPNYGWKGSSKNHHKALRTAEKAAAAGLTIHRGGKDTESDDAALRAKMEADGQGRLID